MARPREFDADRALGRAMQVFWDQGYGASTFNDLVKKAGVQKQSLYGAFGDKRSLFLKSLKLYRTQALSMFQEALDGAGSPLEGIARLMRYASRPTGPGKVRSGCLMTNTALEMGLSDPGVAAEVRQLFRGIEGLLTAAVKKGQERGEITTRFDSAAIGRSLANTINGIRVLEASGASDRHVRSVVEMALAAIRRSRS